ncbi:hypothetical protein JCGZ_23039 [Jatropha curcas]|uniref:Uncharacterized protein n=1 Tax=Jatropha curcas TaxID=180498 RepID=A0A067JPZ1_JATCU|nr:hypothetical protein JCGZ_23039 [Jatropha curcas]
MFFYRWLEAGRLIQTRLAPVVRVEIVVEDTVHVGEEGLSLLLLLEVRLGLHPPLSLPCLSLPYVPSSSTLLPGPAESSPASQSPTAPTSLEPRDKLSLAVGHMGRGYYGYAKSGLGEIVRSTAWEDPAFKRKCEIFAQNRHSETGSDGARPSRHTGGSIFAKETSRLLAKKYGREPTPMAVFTYTHIKDHDGNTFVDRRALGVNENYSTARERVVSSQAESEPESTIDELALYLEAVGGKKKRKVYGIGSQASQFYYGSASYASTASLGPQPDHSAEEISALRACVDEQERQLAELRAHVMRMSGQHGASTSSFDPPPTTDRDVSTALHQPLSSPRDLDTADDTLVTPADTTTHLVDTLANAATLDHAEDRPRRFDFRPF